MSASGNSAYISITFLLVAFSVHFLATISTVLKSTWKLVFFYLLWFLEKFVFAIYENFEAELGQNGKKSKNLFNKCALEFNFAPITKSGFFIL